ncbi:MAG: hypothetical protein E6H10_06165 [Bacteroidetes bacterium]|nr:MAG: hypothetical protein E6H10_06165 [Bacteroidota bacterium]
MEKQIHPNFKKASNIIFGTVGLGLINLFLSRDTLSYGKNLFVVVFIQLIIVALGYLVRRGYRWTKYLLLVLTFLGLTEIPSVINNLTQKPMVELINIAQTIMQIWTVVLLFKVPESLENNSTEQTHSPKSNNSLSIVGLVLLLVPILIWALWIGTFSSNPSALQAEKVEIYLSYFPTFLRGGSSISLIVVALAVSSILFTILGRKKANTIFKVVGIFVIIAGSLVLLLQLFTML